MLISIYIGISLYIDLQVSVAFGALHISVSLAASLMGEGRSSGVLGTYDNNADNDLTLRNGIVVEAEEGGFTENQIFAFTQSCEYM